MHILKRISYLLAFTLLSACTPGFMPEDDFIKANNYMVIEGEVEPGTDVDMDREAMYPNGIQGINSLISQNVKYPPMAVKAEIQGTVYVEYVVEKDGYVGRINVVKGLHPTMNQEAIRVIKLMERWVPAIKDGKAVPVRFTQPIRFAFAD